MRLRKQVFWMDIIIYAVALILLQVFNAPHWAIVIAFMIFMFRDKSVR